jgi:hypothetical protein
MFKNISGKYLIPSYLKSTRKIKNSSSFLGNKETFAIIKSYDLNGEISSPFPN